MRTRAKLLLGTFGIVTVTTGLALWQNQPLRLESVGRPLPVLNSISVDRVRWLSDHEVVILSMEHHEDIGELNIIRDVDLNQETKKVVPFTLTELTKERFRAVVSVAASPNGKWLVCEEQVERKHKALQRSLLLMHPDGTGLRRFPFPKGTITLEHSYWLPDSSHWVSYGRLYSVDGNPTTNATFAKALPPTAIQSDGRWLYPFESSSLAFSLCNPNQTAPCEQLVFTPPPGRSKAESHHSFLSRDSQSLVVEFDVPATAIPERETWEVLLKRELPIGHQELWKLSRTGKPRLLLREAVTKKHGNAFFVESVSPDGTQALVKNAEGEYYLLKL